MRKPLGAVPSLALPSAPGLPSLSAMRAGIAEMAWIRGHGGTGRVTGLRNRSRPDSATQQPPRLGNCPPLSLIKERLPRDSAYRCDCEQKCEIYVSGSPS